MSEHMILGTALGAMLLVSMLLTAFVGYLAYRAHRSSQQTEGMIAATFLEVRKVLREHR